MNSNPGDIPECPTLVYYKFYSHSQGKQRKLNHFKVRIRGVVKLIMYFWGLICNKNTKSYPVTNPEFPRRGRGAPPPKMGAKAYYFSKSPSKTAAPSLDPPLLPACADHQYRCDQSSSQKMKTLQNLWFCGCNFLKGNIIILLCNKAVLLPELVNFAVTFRANYVYEVMNIRKPVS